MITYALAQTDEDLKGILSLQKANLATNLSADEVTSQGFVTVVHSIDDLRKLNKVEKHIIAKDGNEVIAYLLAMTAAAKDDIPVLQPMFNLFGQIHFHHQPVSSYVYIVVGQVCVDKRYRGQGILDDCYTFYKKSFSPHYDFAITEIASRNTRSLAAHKRVGFIEAHRYIAPNHEEWSVVIWPWK